MLKRMQKWAKIAKKIAKKESKGAKSGQTVLKVLKKVPTVVKSGSKWKGFGVL